MEGKGGRPGEVRVKGERGCATLRTSREHRPDPRSTPPLDPLPSAARNCPSIAEGSCHPRRHPAVPTAAPPPPRLHLVGPVPNPVPSPAVIKPSVAFNLRPTVAEIDLSALASNTRVAIRSASGARLIAVVKADAYGHGAATCAGTLLDAGAWGLAVSLVEEGVELRAAGVSAPILVLGGAAPGSEDLVVASGMRPVVWSQEQIRRLAAAARRAGTRCPIHLKIDTGMSRLGALLPELPALAECFAREASDALSLEGVMSHFACADSPDGEAESRRQLARFHEGLTTLRERGLEPVFSHICNSAGLARFPEAHLGAVRAGIALFGAASSPEVALDGLRPVMQLRSRLAAIRELPAGASVSYGHRTTLERDTRAGVVPVGYEDGYQRRMSASAHMLVRGRPCRILGNITMDLVLIDLNELEGEVADGERVVLLGRDGEREISVFDWARWADVIPYEVMCGISARVPRRAVVPVTH